MWYHKLSRSNCVKEVVRKHVKFGGRGKEREVELKFNRSGKGLWGGKKKVFSKRAHAPANEVNVQAVRVLGPSHPLGNVRGQLLGVGVGVVATAVGKGPRAAGHPLGKCPAEPIEEDVRVALLGIHHELPLVAPVVVLLSSGGENRGGKGGRKRKKG